MEDKLFGLMEKMYNEISDIKTKMATKEDVTKIETKIDVLQMETAHIRRIK